MDEHVDSSMGSQQPQLENKEGNNKCFHLFNCDKTYNLDVVGKLINDIKATVKDKLGHDITISTEKYFRLFEMSQLCETIQSGPPMDFAIFVVHANESRLSINEENAGIGYARFYKALLQAAGERVIVVIGGDDNYRSATEEETAVLSRWAKRQISSQFKDEFMDGRKSFIFSWNKKHRSIHEEALLHFLDPGKKGTKFVYEPKSQPTTTTVDTNQAAPSKEISKVDLKAKTELNYTNVQPVKDETPTSLPTEFKSEPGNASVDKPLDKEEPRREEPVQSIPEVASKIHSVSELEFAWSKQLKATVNDTSSKEKTVAILCRDQSDTTIIKDVFGDELLNKVHIFSGVPDAGPKSLLSVHSVRSCVIVVDARTMEEELHPKAFETPYKSLLVAAKEAAEQKVVVILCSDIGKTSQNGENATTGKIKQLLGDKGIVLWWKDHKHSLVENKNLKRAFQSNRSKSLPDDGVAKRSMGSKPPPINPAEFTLLLKTRMHRGRISYQEKDVQERIQEWTAPDYMANDLVEKWHSTADAELLIYRERNTDNYRVVVNDEKDSQSANNLGDSIKGAVHSFGGYLSSKIESSIGSISDNELGDVLYHTF